MDHPPRKKAIFHATVVCTMPRATQYVFSVAAGILPAVEPGNLPGGMGEWFEKTLPLCTAGPGGKMPPSTAAKMAAATDVNPASNTYQRRLIASATAPACHRAYRLPPRETFSGPWLRHIHRAADRSRSSCPCCAATTDGARPVLRPLKTRRFSESREQTS